MSLQTVTIDEAIAELVRELSGLGCPEALIDLHIQNLCSAHQLAIDAQSSTWVFNIEAGQRLRVCKIMGVQPREYLLQFPP